MDTTVPNQVVFYLNRIEHAVGSSLDPNTSLNAYIRNHAQLKGTKAMCHEGGCGACIVSVKTIHPVTKEETIFSVNSCLVSVFSCHGWSITTVEGLGDRHRGYHAIQSRLAAYNGTQCGYCSPGWVMNMFSVWQASGEKLSAKEVENSFAGNICRCTGYRPILEAFKSFAYDCDQSILDKIPDIEDMSGIRLCRKTGEVCKKICDDHDEANGFCMIGVEHSFTDLKKPIAFEAQGVKWFKVHKIDDIFDVLDKTGTESYMLVAGNTAQGIYHINDLPKTMIDISSIEELKKHSLETNLSIGGGMTLNEVMALFKKLSAENNYYKYLQQFYNHLDLVAHVPVRNIGTIAGNLMIKHAHNDFPSDIFLLFETVGAVITLLQNSTTSKVSLSQFLKTDMKGKVIVKICLPPLDCECVFQSYKIMPRAQNAHALVNAGFLFNFNANNKSLIESVSIVYGNINPNFVHATATENYLKGKNIFDEAVLKMAITTLAGELLPDGVSPEPSAEFRKKLALGLFYKCILHITPEASINSHFVSGGKGFERPVSRSSQVYYTDKNLWPLNQPIPKLEALVQCSGEGVFMNDTPNHRDEVYVAFVLSTVYGGTIKNIDPSEALNVKGVIAFYSAKDIPGANNFTPAQGYDEEEIFAKSKVKYHGQPVGIIVAETENLANRVSKLVKVTYGDLPTTPPILTIRDALKAPKDKSKLVNNVTINPTDQGKDVFKVIKGSFEIFGQYHYTMETQTCICIPIEDGLDVYSSTQTMDHVQMAIAYSLKMPLNKINLNVRRLGGAYGSKISRSNQIACACALAAYLLNRPARFVMSLIDNMMAIGKRIPCTSDYEVGVNSLGEIQYLKNTFYQDNGSNHNETASNDTATRTYSCYNPSRWYISGNSVLTDTASNTWCRAPGTTEGVAMIENIMEHISYELGLDPTSVRLANTDKNDTVIPELINDLKLVADYDKRRLKVEDFNKNNRWKKRGISLVPLKYVLYVGGYFNSFVSVYQADGTVAVTHGGIEMGQGLNTKVAQVCAHILGIPLCDVSIKPSNTVTGSNAATTGGSSGSELVCYATIRACQIILENLEPVRKKMKDPTWKQLITEAYNQGVHLTATYTYTANNKEIQTYYIYGVTISEVEVDMLTGNHEILRVDILEDAGQSMSPEVDIGQVEGAFVMGVGYWTSERLVYDKKTGALLTNRTWNYKPPGVKDIPLDFRVQFRKNSDNPIGVLKSKATGEPPLNMSISVAHALRQAITSARQDAGLTGDKWIEIDAPYTTENILLSAHSQPEDFVLQ